MNARPSTHYVSAAKLTLTQAIDAALRAAPGLAYKAKLKEKHGFLVYKISIVSAGQGPVQVRVDPGTGAILEVEKKGRGGEHDDQE